MQANVADETSVFQPDLITPEQHGDRVRAEVSDRPEIRLMLAIMEDAVGSIQRFAACPKNANRHEFEDASAWIASTDRAWPYSFENVCDALSLNSGGVRRVVRSWSTAGPQPERVEPYRFPFRRVNGKRHSISVRDRSARQQA